MKKPPSTLLVLLLLLAIIAWSALLASVVQAAPPTQEPSGLSRLKEKVKTEGAVRVIAGLNVPFEPEGKLPAQAARGQQRRIANMQRQVIRKLTGQNVKLVATFEFIPYMALEVDAKALQTLSTLTETTTIVEDMDLRPVLESSIPIIEADQAWSAGYTGSGQVVAIIDTGVDKTHPFLDGGKVVSEACYSTTSSTTASVCPDGSESSTATGSGVDCTDRANTLGYTAAATSDCGHGTHVADIAAGLSSSSTYSDGVAKGSDIIAIQVASIVTASDTTTIKTTNILQALERVYALRNTYTIAAVNMSLGGGKYTATCDSASTSLKDAIDNLRSAGIATIVASGNDGYTNGISFPACISSAISVGATNDSDVVASFSNVASFLDLLAPGVAIRAAWPDNQIATASGTSQATPHVTGAWALLREAHPNTSIDDILGALQATGTLVDDDTRSDGSSGSGVTNIPRINLYQAIQSIQADLDITKSVDPTTALPGEAITYTIAFSNIGDGTASGVIISDIAPSQLSGISYHASVDNGVTVTPTEGITYEWSVSDLAPGKGGLITITGQLNSNLSAGTLFTNTAAIAPTTDDSDTSNNTTEAGLTVSNAAPLLASIGDQTITETYILAFTANATDGNGDALTYGLDNPPSGANINSSSGEFSWTPGEAQGPGVYTFSVVVSDTANLTGTTMVMVTVNEENSTPVLAAIGAQSIPETQPFNLALSASDEDDPANSLTYSMSGAPGGASLDTNSGLFNWTPGPDQGPGSYQITFIVSDNGSPVLTDSQTITIDVYDAPGVVITESGGSTEVTEDGPGDAYQVSLNTQPTANVTVTLVADSQVNVSASSLLFSPLDWDTPQTVTVSAVDDAVYEGPHSGSISHAANSNDSDYNGTGIGDVTANINDNDNLPTVTVSDAGVDESAGAASINVTLTGQSVYTASVNYTFSDGTASGGVDYSAADGALTWPANQSGAQTIAVNITQDALAEPDETVNITLSGAISATIVKASGVLTISDNGSASNSGNQIFLPVVVKDQ